MWRSKTRCATGFFAVALLVLSTGAIFGQQPHAQVPAYLDVYYARSGIAPAQLKPLRLSDLARMHGCRRYRGSALVAAIIGPNGRPRYAYFIRPVGNALDKIILTIITMDRFKPATLDGMPVAAAMEVKLKEESCAVQTDQGNGHKGLFLKLDREPTQSAKPMEKPLNAITRIVEAARPGADADMVTPVPAGPGFSVVPPQSVNSVEAQYTEEARKKGISGICLVQTMVGVNGMPEDPQVLKSLEPGLDRNALIAVGRMRFTPALKSGVPIPVTITVQVKFRSY